LERKRGKDGKAKEQRGKEDINLKEHETKLIQCHKVSGIRKKRRGKD